MGAEILWQKLGGFIGVSLIAACAMSAGVGLGSAAGLLVVNPRDAAIGLIYFAVAALPIAAIAGPVFGCLLYFLKRFSAVERGSKLHWIVMGAVPLPIAAFLHSVLLGYFSIEPGESWSVVVDLLILATPGALMGLVMATFVAPRRGAEATGTGIPSA